MSQLIAPYNNSMRLGQGFNSYTHQNCLLDAVTIKKTDIHTPDSSEVSADHHDDHNDNDEVEKAQIVSFSTRFVEKISDVVSESNDLLVAMELG